MTTADIYAVAQSLTYLIEFHNLWCVFFLINLLLSFQQGVFAVLTATDSFIILFIQNRAHTAYAANAATPGAMDTAGWGVRACMRTQGLSAGTSEFAWKLYTGNFTVTGEANTFYQHKQTVL